jgi:hypothetical protein
VVIQYVWAPFSTVSLFNLGDIMMKSFAMFIGDGSHVFRKKNPNGNEENEVSVMLHHVALCV